MPSFEIPKMPTFDMNSSVEEIKSFFINLVSSRFAPDDLDFTCGPIEGEDKCNAIEQCSYCHTDKSHSCRTTKAALKLPPGMYKCSKVTEEEKKATKLAIAKEVSAAIGLEFNSTTE